MYRYRATVRRIVDGDTLDLDVDMGFRAWRLKERFRLAGINALFFWQEDHCKLAWEMEVSRARYVLNILAGVRQ